MVFIFVVTLFCFSIGLWIELGKLNFFFFFFHVFQSSLYFSLKIVLDCWTVQLFGSGGFF